MDQRELLIGDNLVVLYETESKINESDYPEGYSGEKNLVVSEGDWMEKDENGEWYADWSLSLIHPEGDTDNWLYYEQGTKESAIHNFMRSLEEE